MEIIAHRGASFDAPENTLASVNLAWQQKADAVEVDIQLSRDNQLVVIHDENTRKTAGLKKRVREQTLAELKVLDAGRWKALKWAGEAIPTLDEVLAAIPEGKRLFIEIKAGAECLPELEKVLRRSGKPLQQLVTIGFALQTMAMIKKRLPALEVCWIAQLKRNWKTGRWFPKTEALIDEASEAGLDGLDLGARGPISAELVQKIKKAKLKLYVWTVDSLLQARKLMEAGVDGITTNRPGWLRQQLNDSK